jgi:hypothetical protein
MTFHDAVDILPLIDADMIKSLILFSLQLAELESFHFILLKKEEPLRFIDVIIIAHRGRSDHAPQAMMTCRSVL